MWMTVETKVWLCDPKTSIYWIYIEYIEWSLLVFETSLRLLWDFEFSRLPWSVLRSRLAWRSHSASTYSDLDQAPRHDANRLPQVAPRTVKSAKCACKCEFELYSLLRSSPSHGLVADTLFPNYSKLKKSDFYLERLSNVYVTSLWGSITEMLSYLLFIIF